MPSYHLASKMNLGDVDDIYKAKINLNIGPFFEQDSNEIFITNGHAQINEFVLTSNITSNLYLSSDDNIGTLKWSKPPIEYWAQNYISNVSLAGFCNDVSFAYESNTSLVSFTSHFVDLHDEPTVSDIIPMEKKSNILRAYCNLSELRDSEQARDTIYSNLELKSLAFKQASLTTIRDVTVVENFYIFGNCNQVGNLLKASESNDTNEYDTTITNWYDVFYDSHCNLRDIFKLINSYSNDTTTSSVTSTSLSNVYESLNSTIISKQGFTDQEIEILMSERMMNGEFLIKTSNLSESILDNPKVQSNLQLGDLSLVTNYGSITNAKKLCVENIFDWNGSKDIYDINGYSSNQEVLLTTTSNNLGFIQLSQLLSASFSNKGVVYFNSNINSSNFSSSNIENLISFCNEVLNSYTAFTIHTDVQQTLSNLQDTVYYTFPDFNDSGLIYFLDNTLSQFSNFINIRPIAYSNLELSTISHTSLYSDLITAPTTLLPFSNDIGFLLQELNGREYKLNAFDCRQTLLCGDIATQNRHTFNITNGNVILNDITVYDNFVYNTLQNDVSNKWMKCVNTNSILWKDLHKATTELEGVVKQLSSYTVADYEATINAKVFNDMYVYFSSNIERIQEKMRVNGIPI